MGLTPTTTHRNQRPRHAPPVCVSYSTADLLHMYVLYVSCTHFHIIIAYLQVPPFASSQRVNLLDDRKGSSTPVRRTFDF